MRQQRGELLAVATTQFDHSAAVLEYLSDRGRVLLKQLQLGSRDPVPRQMTNRVEERRAQRVVEESRRQLPWGQLEIEPDVVGKAESLMSFARFDQVSFIASAAVRSRTASQQNGSASA